MSLGLQQILNRHLPSYARRYPLNGRQASVCRHIQGCRTEAMGGLELQCHRCGYQQRYYFACRDRHCPLCQQLTSEQWAQAQQQTVLPTVYYHLVFTLPHALNDWIQRYPKPFYSLLFSSTWNTLKRFAQDPKRLGGRLGMTAVLHTWGQALGRHVHLHCLVPGGVLTPDGRWREAKGHYLFPVRALSRVYRGMAVSQLRGLLQAGQLPAIAATGRADHLLEELMQRDWVVYARPCMQSTRQVINYLARYSHRTAISNQRLISSDDTTVSFRYRDYQESDRAKVMTLSTEEFIRRFLLHVLPKGLMRIRHYGYLANCCRRRQLARIRAAICQMLEESAEREKVIGQALMDKPAYWLDGLSCPKCQAGKLLITGEIVAVWPGGG